MAQSRVGSSGNKVLAELSQDPTARKNKHDELRRKFDALERHADFLETRLKATEKSGNQGAYNAILQQLQNAETRINNLATEMNSIAESDRYSKEQERKRQKIPDSKPKTMMDSVRESLPYQIGSGIRDMIVDTGKGIGQTALYGENAIRGSTLGKNDKGFTTLQLGKAGTQLNPNTMQMEDIQFGDVADVYAKELGKNTGTYIDALNSMMHWRQGRLKPDSQDERFRKMIGDVVPRIFGTKDIKDPTVAKGAEVIADPLAFLGGAVRGAKVTAKAIDEFGDIAKGFRRADGKYVPMDQAGMFVPLTPYSQYRQLKPSVMKRLQEGFDDPISGFENDYSPTIANAYKKFMQMKGEGKSPEEIFKETRVFENVDGVPYFETDDSLAKLDQEKLREALSRGESIAMNKVFSHPELSDADMRRFGKADAEYAKFFPQIARGGAYHPLRGDISLNPEDADLSLALHELTHKSAIDAGLELAGSNVSSSSGLPKLALDHYANVRQDKIMHEMDYLIDDVNKARNRMRNAENNPEIPESEKKKLRYEFDRLTEKKEKLQEESIRISKRNSLPYIPPDAYFAYMANNNETLARLAQERMNLTGAQRGEQIPNEPNYMRQTAGFAPDETWFARYEGIERVPVFPENIRESALRYLRGEEKVIKDDTDLFSEEFDLSGWNEPLKGSDYGAYNAPPFEIDPEYYQRYYDRLNKRKK